MATQIARLSKDELLAIRDTSSVRFEDRSSRVLADWDSLECQTYVQPLHVYFVISSHSIGYSAGTNTAQQRPENSHPRKHKMFTSTGVLKQTWEEVMEVYIFNNVQALRNAFKLHKYSNLGNIKAEWSENAIIS